MPEKHVKYLARGHGGEMYSASKPEIIALILPVVLLFLPMKLTTVFRSFLGKREREIGPRANFQEN